MKLFPTDDDLKLYETGFEGDFLGRRRLSEQLSELVEKIENPIVLALDDEWGNGKTYFLKRWVGAHTKENAGTATTVYFDAFEHDYLSEPLVSIISAVSDRLPEEQRKVFDVTKSLIGKLAKPAFVATLSALTFGAKQQLDEMGDAIADALSAETKDLAAELWRAEQERKDAVREFKRRLIEVTGSDEPALVIVIDELDRCRPDYALSVLEIIKHFFSVPKVHFILGVNGAALECSVRSRYGADTDAERYLRKFINLSFSLPKAIGHGGQTSVLKRYATNLIEEMGLPRKIADGCVEVIGYVSEGREIALRDVEKVLSMVALLPKSDEIVGFHEGFIDILCILIVSSVVEPEFHSKLLFGEASSEEMRNFFNAPERVTSDRIGEERNEDYDHARAYWYFMTRYCCSAPVKRTEGEPRWVDDIGTRFDPFGRPRAPGEIPARLQSEFVDLFRLGN